MRLCRKHWGNAEYFSADGRSLVCGLPVHAVSFPADAHDDDVGSTMHALNPGTWATDRAQGRGVMKLSEFAAGCQRQNDGSEGKCIASNNPIHGLADNGPPVETHSSTRSSAPSTVAKESGKTVPISPSIAPSAPHRGQRYHSARATKSSSARTSPFPAGKYPAHLAKSDSTELGHPSTCWA
jgi:hypothetical protein